MRVGREAFATPELSVEPSLVGRLRVDQDDVACLEGQLVRVAPLEVNCGGSLPVQGREQVQERGGRGGEGRGREGWREGEKKKDLSRPGRKKD